jgi:hypothetical protein
MENYDKMYAELRMELATKLQDILNSSVEKKSLSVEVIKQRMDSLRQAILDEGDRNFYEPPVGVIFDNGQPKYTSPIDCLNCALLSKAASSAIVHIHDRMSVVLKPEHFNAGVGP